MDDKHSYGAGSSKGGKKKSGGSSGRSKEQPKTTTVRMTESDPSYPKDIPSGFPYEIIWRKELREVIDQGVRRLCWTIASTRNLTSQFLINQQLSMHFSVVHLLVGLFDKTDEMGGLRNMSHLKKFLEENGAVLEEDCECVDPIAEMKKKMNSKGKSKIPPPVLCTHKLKPKKVFKVKELIVLTNVKEEELIKLVSKGPVAISIVHHPEFEKFTGDGIYKGVDKSRAPTDYHMLLCSGYGTLNGEHYWDVQNSAGVKWGNKGFGKIIRQISRGGGRPSLIRSVIYPLLFEDYTGEE